MQLRALLLLLALSLAALHRAGGSSSSDLAGGDAARSALEEEAAAARLAKKHAAAAALQQRSASRARWNSSVVIVVTWHNHSIDWLAEYSPEHISFALFIKGGPYTCADVPTALRASVAHCEKGGNVQGREAHTMGLFLSRWYAVLPRVTVFTHDNEYGGLMHPLRGLNASGVRAWVRSVEAQPSPLFRERATCLCVHDARETHWRTYGPRKDAMVWFMERVLGFHNASDRWSKLAYPPTASLAVPARAVLTRPRLVYELIYALTNGTEEGLGQGPEPLLGLPQLTFNGWESHNGGRTQRRWMPFSWAHNFERLWFAVFDVDYDPQAPWVSPPPPQEGRA